jgi:DNA polymerase-1
MLIMKKLALIDGNAIIHRAYHSMPKTFTNGKGEQTNAVYGFALTLIRMIEDLQPTHIVCSFDLAGPTFRHEKFADYKGKRVKADQELYDQIPKVKELVETMGIQIIEKQGFEADDIIGTTVEKIHRGEIKDGDMKIYIVTGDKDAFQLLGDNVFIYDLKNSGDGSRIIDAEAVKKKYNLEPRDFIDLKALSGDSSDNIPGVPGIGDKTATTLIQQFGDLDNIYRFLEETITKKQDTNKSQITNPNSQKEIKPRIAELLLNNKDQAYLSRELGTIHTEAPIDFTLEDIEWGDYDKDDLMILFQDLGFRSLIARFSRANSQKATEPVKTEVQQKDQQLKLL